MLPLATSAILAMFALGARGQTLGTTFSVDYQGPTAGGVPGESTGVLDGFGAVNIDEGSILTPAPPGPPGPNLPALGPLPAPGVVITASDLGIDTTPQGSIEVAELDALSYGRDELFEEGASLYFSVDEFAAGVPNILGNNNVFTEGLSGNDEASADIFRYLRADIAFPDPNLDPMTVNSNVAVFDGDGLSPFGGPGFGLVEPNNAELGLPDEGDNLDAVDLGTTSEDLTGPVYLSLDSDFRDPLESISDLIPPNTGTAILQPLQPGGFSGADVLVSTPDGGGMRSLSVFASAGVLGLDLQGKDTDDLDALALFDAVRDGGEFDPENDRILFSVRRNSAVIGQLDSRFGLAIGEGDILSLPTGVGDNSDNPSIFFTAEDLGLLRGETFVDDLDALDVANPSSIGDPTVVPEPSTVLGIAAVAGFGTFLKRKSN